MSRFKVVLTGTALAAISVVGVAGPATASTETVEPQGPVLECEMIFSDAVCARIEGTAGTVFDIVENFDEPSEIAAYIEAQYDWLKCRIDPTTCW